jgi:hypothetical protein
MVTAGGAAAARRYRIPVHRRVPPGVAGWTWCAPVATFRMQQASPVTRWISSTSPAGHVRVAQHAPRAVAGHPDHRDHVAAGLGQVDVRVVAGHHADALQAPHPLGHGGRREVHAAGQLAVRQPGVPLQLRQQGPVPCRPPGPA